MSVLLTEKKDAVLVITMNRPEKHNALNTELTQQLVDALKKGEADHDVKAIVLTGNGKSFCAGADTKEFSSLTPSASDAVLDRADLTTGLHLLFSKVAKPITGTTAFPLPLNVLNGVRNTCTMRGSSGSKLGKSLQ